MATATAAAAQGAGGAPPATTAGAPAPGAAAPTAAAPAAVAPPDGAPTGGAPAPPPGPGGPPPPGPNAPGPAGPAPPGPPGPPTPVRPSYQRLFAGMAVAGPANYDAIKDSVGGGNNRGHAQCMAAAVTIGRRSTVHAYLLFMRDAAGSATSRVAVAPIAHDDFPGTPATDFGGHTLVQVGDVAYTNAGHRVQREQQLPDDAFSRPSIRVPTTAVALHGAKYGLAPSQISARSSRSSGAMAMMCGGVDTSRSRLQGRWKSDIMFRYLMVQHAPLCADISQRMVNGGNFTTPPTAVNPSDAESRATHQNAAPNAQAMALAFAQHSPQA